MKKLSFEQWMEKVNSALPISSDDLPDVCYRDWYDEGMSPKAAAREAMKNAQDF